MKTTALLFVAALFVAAFVSVNAQEQKGGMDSCCAPEVKVKKEIDTKLFIDIKGKRIYTCCQECLDKIKADPEKFIKDIEDGGVKFDSLENCQYFIEKSPDSSKWEFAKLRKISTPIDIAVTDKNSINIPKPEGDSTPKVMLDSTKKIVDLTSPKIVLKDSPKIDDGINKGHLPAPGQ